jgi:hypothetical protein
VGFISKWRIACGLLVIAFFSWSVVLASAQPVDPGVAVQLRVYNNAKVGNATLERVLGEVKSIFQRVDVRVEWVTADDPQFRIFIVQSLPGLAAVGEDIFGYTPRNLDGTHGARAYVIYDRIQEFIRDSESWRYPPLEPVYLLPYSIAHEIGHLLLPPRSHSLVGIMRGRWTDNDFKAMLTANLNFTSEHAALIRREVSRLSKL